MVPPCWRAVVIAGASGQTMVAFCSSWNNTDTAVNICVIVGLQCLIQGSDQASLQQDERHHNADKQVVLPASFEFIPEKRNAAGNNNEDS